MRRTSLIMFAAVAAAFAVGCSDENPTEVTPGNPSLQLRAIGPCNGLNAVATIPENQIEGNTPIIDLARLTATGMDPGSASGDLTPGTRVVFEVVQPENEDDRLTAGFGGFISTRGQEIYPDASSNPVEFVGPQATGQFYCTTPGTVLIRATVADYAPAAGGGARTLTREFPVRCMDRARYEATCAGLVEDDMGLGADGGTGDMGMATDAGDGGGPDGNPPVQAGSISIRWLQPADPDAMIIGIRDSGLDRSDSVLLSFRVTRNGMPVANKRVRFSLPPNVVPRVEIDPLESFTDDEGIAQVLFRAGGTPGVASVTAITTTDEGAEISGRSGPITIRGGVPSARNMHLTCEDPILPAFTSRPRRGEYLLFSGLLVNTTCHLQLADRLNGFADPGVSAVFLTEAGTVTQAAATDEQGVVEVEYRTGPPIPYDTQPRPYEISAGFDDSYNPRDGVVRIVAFTRGEEDFVDVDGDKIYTGVDLQTPSQDLGEPFVDLNDNGRYDSNLGGGVPEPFSDTDLDTVYTGPDGVWNKDTEIWTTTTVLWVGNVVVPPDPAHPLYPVVPYCRANEGCSFQPLRQDCPPGMIYFAERGRMTVDVRFADRNGNCPDGYGEGESFIDVEGGLTVAPGDGSREFGAACFVFVDDDDEVVLDDDVVSGLEVPRIGAGTPTTPLRPVHRYIVAGPPVVNLEAPPTIDQFVVGVRYRSGGENVEVSLSFNVCY